jgi:hypothetical protein
MDIAGGEATYAELADRHGISHQGVKEFAKRNRAAINQAKQDMASDLAGIWPTHKPLRVSDAMDDLDDLVELLQDPNLTPSARLRIYAEKRKLRHSIADECGQLPTRVPLVTAYVLTCLRLY